MRKTWRLSSDAGEEAVTPSHIRILCALELGVCTVPDLVAALGWRQQTIHVLISDLCRWGKARIVGREGRRYRYAVQRCAK